MSVLNQMLRDLDARQAVPPQVAPLLGAASVTRSQRVPARTIWLATCLLLSACIGWFYLSDDAVSAPAPASRPAAPESAVVAVTASPALHATDVPTVEVKTPAVAQTETPAPVIEQPLQSRSSHTITDTSTVAATATDLSAMAAEQTELPQAGNQQVLAPPAESQVAVPAPQEDSVGGQLSIESVTAAVSSAVPADSAKNQRAGLLLSEATLPALAAQLQQLQQWQQTKNWPALLAAVTPALRQQYPQQVLALEAYAAGQLGDHQRALEAAQRWAQLNPADGRAWLGQAMALDQLAQPAQARQLYLRALQLGGLSPASQQYIRQRLATGG